MLRRLFNRTGESQSPAPEEDPSQLPSSSPAGGDLTLTMQGLSEEHLLAMAQVLAELRPIEVYPGWSFSIAERSPAPIIQLRHAIWKACAEKRMERPIVFPWYDGLKIHLYLGNDMSRPTFVGGCIEPNEFAFMSSVLRPGMVMVDVGANDGFFASFAARRVGEQGRVYAFEPSRREFGRLEANLTLNRLTNVRPIHKGVSDGSGTGVLHICEYGHEGQNTLGDFVHEVNGAGTETVELCSLNDYFSNEKLSRLDFIKIDVEGAEFKVLSGARELISRYKPIVMLEVLDEALHKQGSSADQVIALLKELGCHLYTFSPVTGRLVPSEDYQHSENIVACLTPLPTAE
jgi:FkbM family methyltransferase